MFYVTFYMRGHPKAQFLCWAACHDRHWVVGQTSNEAAKAKFETEEEAERAAKTFFADWDNPTYQVGKC